MNAPHFRRAVSAAMGLAILPVLSAQARQGAAAGRSDFVEEVVVTANRVAVPLRQIGTSVSVLDAAAIEAHGNLALTDVLRQLPAIATSNSGGPGKATSLRIRGEEGFRTLMIFDGMRLSDPSSTQVGPQVENLLSTGVGRIEVLRGPQGLGYGADAGGIVSIDSRQAPGGGLHASFDGQAGAFGTRQLAGAVGGGNGTADLFASVADFETDGFNARSSDTALRDEDGYENTTIHLRGGVNLGERFRADLVHRAVDGTSLYDGCADAATFATIHDCVGTNALQATRGALSYAGGYVTHALAYATTRTERDDFANGSSTFPAAGELNRWEYIGSATELPGVDLVWGGDLEEALNNGVGRNNTGIYGEAISDFSDDLHLSAGARHDDNDDFGTNTSYRVSGAYLFQLVNGAELKLRTSYGTGFRAPSPYEIAYNAGPYASPPAALATLQQEESKGHEFGIEYLSDALHFEAVYFDQQVQNAIEFDLVAYSGYLQERGTSTSEGVEVGAAWTPSPYWHLTVNYTHNETTRPNGLQRQRRPEDLLNFGLSFYGLSERLSLHAFYRVARNAIDSTNPPLVQLDDFAVLDLSARFSVTDRIQVYGRLENALDEDYEEIRGYFTAGRAAYVGFRLLYAGL